MNFIEMIGFVISLLALFALAAKKSYEERRRRNNPDEVEQEEREQTEKLKSFLHSLDMDMEEDSRPRHSREQQTKPQEIQHKLPKPHYQTQRSVEKSKSFTNNIKNGKFESSFEKNVLKSSLDDPSRIPLSYQHTRSTDAHHLREKNAYAIKSEIRDNRAKEILMALKSKKEMIIINEILSPPKALRNQ